MMNKLLYAVVMYRIRVRRVQVVTTDWCVNWSLTVPMNSYFAMLIQDYQLSTFKLLEAFIHAYVIDHDKRL